MAKKNDMAGQNKDQLIKLAHETREELRTLRFSVAGSKNKDVKQAAKLRKKLARMLTALGRTTGETMQGK